MDQYRQASDTIDAWTRESVLCVPEKTGPKAQELKRAENDTML